MSTLHLVDPQLRPLLAMWPTVELDDEALKVMRERQMPMPEVDRSGVSIEQVNTPGRDGAPDVTLFVYKPETASGPLPVVYHMHGGGYVGGNAGEVAFRHVPLVKELGCAVVTVEYRLAPETVFPGAIEDCYAGLAWTFANAEAQGFDAVRIGVTGESAGGGLAAALALLARDRGEYPLAFQHLIYPMIDDRTGTSGDPHPQTGEFIWTPHNNRFGWRALLGAEPGGADVSPYAAAARAEDLSGLPPTFIYSGALDLFLEEDVEYARRLIRAGVPTELHVYPGAYHGFELMSGSGVGEQATRDSRAALARFLKAGG